MPCSCNGKNCPECCGGWVNEDTLLDPKDREKIQRDYKAELKMFELKAAFYEFSRSCHYTVTDPYGNTNVDSFDWRVKDTVIGDAEKFKVFKKLLENF